MYAYRYRCNYLLVVYESRFRTRETETLIPYEYLYFDQTINDQQSIIILVVVDNRP